MSVIAAISLAEKSGDHTTPLGAWFALQPASHPFSSHLTHLHKWFLMSYTHYKSYTSLNPKASVLSLEKRGTRRVTTERMIYQIGRLWRIK
jgi:hypothetical protein